MNMKSEQEIDNQVKEAELRLQEQAVDQAFEHLRKNDKEIKRLKALAETALFEDNKESYIYAIGKLRVLYKQPELSNEVLEMQYRTTRQTIIDMIKEQSTIK